MYRKDKETVDWIVMQDVKDPRAFTIVERFEQESVWTTFSIFECSSYTAPREREVRERRKRKKKKRLEVEEGEMRRGGGERMKRGRRGKSEADEKTEPKVPPREPLLEDLRSICCAVVGGSYGFEET